MRAQDREYYLNEDIILPNVPTYICAEDRDRKYVLENIASLVVKAANESGGYGMLVGPHSSKSEQRRSQRRSKRTQGITSPAHALVVASPDDCRRIVRGTTRRSPSLHSVWQGHLRAARRPDAVALKKGSLVVNSSQGGGSKDTWVLAGDPRVETDRPEVDAVMTPALRG